MNNRREQEEKPSLGRRIMRVAAPIGSAAAVLAVAHARRARVPTGVKNPETPSAKERLSFFHPTPEPRFPKPVDPKNPRSTRWLTQSQIDGKSVVPKPGPLYEGPDLHENVGKPMAAAAAAPKVADVVPMPGAADKPVRTTEDARKTGRKILSDADSGPSLKDIKAKHSTPPAPAKVKGQKVVDVNAEQAAKLAERSKKKAVARAKSKIKEIKAGGKITEASAQRLNEILFNDGNADFGNLMGASDRVMTAYRKGRRMVPWIRRGGQVAGDVGDVASGKKPKDPFWNKTWAKSAAVGALIGAPILAARKINTWHHQDLKFPNSVHDTSPKLGRLKETILKKARQADAKWVANGLKKGVKREPIFTNEGPFFASKIKNPVLLQAVLRKVEFARRDERDKKMSTGKKLAIVGGSLGLAAAASAPGIAAYRNMTKTGRELPKAMESLRRASQEVGDVARSIKESRNKTWLRRRLGFAAKVKNPVLLQAVLRKVEFAKSEKDDSKTRKAIRGAGLASAAIGVATLPAAAPMLRIAARSKTPGGNSPDKFIPDYLSSAQRLLNGPITGGIAGKVIQNKRLTTKPNTLPRFMADHYARFRAGPKQAFDHWQYEVGESLANKAKARGIAPSDSPGMKRFLGGMNKVQGRINQGLWKRGLNETEAIARSLRSNDPEVRDYSRLMMTHKAKAAAGYAKYAAISPGLVAGGAAAYAAARPKDKEEKKFQAVGFSTVDPLERGWDLRDARGRSARVYAPGSRKRQRREKEWNERVDNIRLVRNIAIGASLAGAGGTLYYRNRLKKAINPNPRKGHVPHPDILSFPTPAKPKALAAKLRPVELATPAIRKLGEAVADNVSLPEREPTTAEQAYAAIQKLPPKQRRGVLRILGAGTLAAGGVVAGKIAKRPILGSLVGGTAAGLTLG